MGLQERVTDINHQVSQAFAVTHDPIFHKDHSELTIHSYVVCEDNIMKNNFP